MFLSNNSSSSTSFNNNNCIDQPMFDKSFFINDVSPNSKMYPPSPIHDQYYYSSSSSSSLFHFSPNFIDHHHHHHHHNNSSDDQDIIALLQQHQDLLVGQFSQQQQQQQQQQPHLSSGIISKQTGTHETETGTDQTVPLNYMINNNNMEKNININIVDPVIVWKRPRGGTSKKDRHSKIVTAQGPRDRRMRLSLEIAHRFFTLQDMLGFDKASKTVEWLLTKSNAAIKELISTGRGSNSTLECHDDADDDENKLLQLQAAGNNTNPKEEKRVRASTRRKPTFHPHPLLAKDSRVKARARARERTFEKIRSRTSTSFEITAGEESPGSQSHDHDMRSSTSLEVVAADQDHVEEDPTSSFFDYNYEIKTSQDLNLNNNNCNFPENWDIDSGRAHSSYYSMAANNVQHLSTTDFQFLNKPWIT